MGPKFCEQKLRLFHRACKQNILDDIRRYVKQGYPVNSHADSSLGEKFSGYTPLHFAVENRDEETVIYLLENDSDITERNADCLTPVHLAYYIEATDLISTIFKHSTSFKTYENVVDRSGLTTFHICCALGIPVLNQFINNEVNVNCSVSLLADKDCGFTPLHFAVRNGSIEDVSLLFENYANPHITCEGGLSLLHIASEGSDSSAIVELLLLYETDMKIKDNKGRTALHSAVEHQRLNIIKVLIKRGASIHERDLENQTPFDLAVKSRQYAAVDTMLTLCKSSFETPISFSDIFDFDEFCGVSSEANMSHIKTSSEQDSKRHSYTALHFAVQEKREDIMIYLLENGADISAKGDNGWTPVHQAYYNNDSFEQLIYTLFKHSVVNTFVNVADNTGLTHFHICFTMNNYIQTSSLQEFLNSGTDINCATSLLSETDPGFTPLHFAIKRDSMLNVKFLLDHGADHSLRCGRGLTPLQLAIELQRLDCINLLLEAGADFMIRDRRNRLLLHSEFYRNGHNGIVKILLDKIPKDQNYADDRGLTLLHMATWCRRLDIVESLLAQNCCPNGRIIAINETSGETSAVDMHDLTGLTPLHIALSKGDSWSVNELLLAGADINAEDNEGRSTIAFFHDYTSIDSDDDDDDDDDDDYDYDDDDDDDDTIKNFSTNHLVIELQIANHLKKMEVAGLYVSDKVKNDFIEGRKKIQWVRERAISDRVCAAELEKLQQTRIDGCGGENLRSILYKAEEQMVWLIKNKKLATQLNPERLEDLVREFPLYGVMIKSQVNKGLRKILRDQKAWDSLTGLTGISLPELCSRHIFKHLMNEHLENLIDANLKRLKKC